MRAHSRLHTGERPFKCEAPGCDKSFIWKSSLTSHRLTHASGGPSSQTSGAVYGPPHVPEFTDSGRNTRAQPICLQHRDGSRFDNGFYPTDHSLQPGTVGVTGSQDAATLYEAEQSRSPDSQRLENLSANGVPAPISLGRSLQINSSKTLHQESGPNRSGPKTLNQMRQPNHQHGHEEMHPSHEITSDQYLLCPPEPQPAHARNDASSGCYGNSYNKTESLECAMLELEAIIEPSVQAGLSSELENLHEHFSGNSPVRWHGSSWIERRVSPLVSATRRGTFSGSTPKGTGKSNNEKVCDEGTDSPRNKEHITIPPHPTVVANLQSPAKDTTMRDTEASAANIPLSKQTSHPENTMPSLQAPGSGALQLSDQPSASPMQQGVPSLHLDEGGADEEGADNMDIFYRLSPRDEGFAPCSGYGYDYFNTSKPPASLFGAYISKGPSTLASTNTGSTLASINTASTLGSINTASLGEKFARYQAVLAAVPPEGKTSPAAAKFAATAALLNVSPGSSSRRLKLGHLPADFEAMDVETVGKEEPCSPPFSGKGYSCGSPPLDIHRPSPRLIFSPTQSHRNIEPGSNSYEHGI